MTKDIYIYPRPPRCVSEVYSGVDRYLYCLQQSLSYELKTFAAEVVSPNCESDVAVPLEVIPSRSVKSMFRGCLPSSFFLIYGYVRETLDLRAELRKGVGGKGIIHVNRVGCEVQPIAAKLAGFDRVITTVHNLPGEDEYAKHWVRRLIERLSFACADRHICVSQATFDAWHQRVGLRRELVDVIYNGMPVPDYSEFDRTAYRLQLIPDAVDSLWIGICARLHPMKGHSVLLRAFACLLSRDEVAPVVLVIAGSGSLDAELKQLAKDLGIEQYVHFLGHRTDAMEFASAIDLNVLPSIHSETLGYSLIEAMFAARPSVVSDIGGMKELVGDSAGGSVVKARDVDALADALFAYVSDPERMLGDGLRAQRYALKHLTSDQMAEATEKVYSTI